MFFVYYCPNFFSFSLLINSQIGKYMNTKITSTLFSPSVVLIPICILLPILTKIFEDISSTFLHLVEGDNRANDQCASECSGHGETVKIIAVVVGIICCSDPLPEIMTKFIS